jgi:signal transduction histidine kinase
LLLHGDPISIKIKTKLESFYADEHHIEQVLMNLVQNAIKYCPENNNIQIIWELDSEQNVVLRVKDNGIGIGPEHLPRLFERFYRVDKARSRSMGGTGLGLSIVKHVTRRHGGSVEVKSEIGQGTEFICFDSS